jgi:hypothetical protein
MKTLSVIGIILSSSGILISISINSRLTDFLIYFIDNYKEKDKIHLGIYNFIINNLEIIRRPFSLILLIFFSFFLILSIKVNRRF